MNHILYYYVDNLIYLKLSLYYYKIQFHYSQFVAYLYPEFAKEYVDISNIEYLL